MGEFAEAPLDLAMREAGGRALDDVMRIYAEHGVRPRSGSEPAASFDAAMQAVLSAFTWRHSHDTQPEEVVDGLAHAAALVIFQQASPIAALEDFASRIVRFGCEILQDGKAKATAGRA